MHPPFRWLGQAVASAGLDVLAACGAAGLRKRLSQGAQNTAGAVFFGNHIATSMALGFLFYGAGTRTFGTSKASVAALVISLFPRLPLSPTDNRCHLQVCPFPPSQLAQISAGSDMTMGRPLH